MRFKPFLFSFLFTLIILFSTWLTGSAAVTYKSPLRQDTGQPPAPSPTYDPLAIPTLPVNPTQFDIGKNLYYYHCMPCHGDLGQGLTDAWRMVWEEDHRNCWGRGCHGGREKDEGFPIPTIVPAIIAPTGGLAKYPGLDTLVSYLHDTHPPQKPGKLKDDEYRALAIFLWVSNNRPLPEQSVAPLTDQTSPTPINTPLPPTLTVASPPIQTASIQQIAGSTSLPSRTSTASSLNARLLGFAVVVLLVLLILVYYFIKRLHRPDRP